MKARRVFTDEALLRYLESNGRSWRDYVLLGDPPLLCHWSKVSGLGLIADDDSDRAHATKELLRRLGASHFASIDDLRQSFPQPSILEMQRGEFVSAHGGLSEERCKCKDCQQPRIKEFAFCYDHCFAKPVA